MPLSFVHIGGTSVTRSENVFTCPICDNKIATTRSFIAHLNKHGLIAHWMRKRKLPDCTNIVDSEEDARVDTVKNKENIAHMPPPLLSLSTGTSKPFRLTHRQTILASSNSLTADQATQEDKVMLAKLGRWIPLVYEHEKQQHGLLTSASSASILLEKELTTGCWSSPTTHDDITEKAAEMASDYDHFMQHIKTMR